MQTVAARHYYRFEYLRSEDWKALRKLALARKNSRCDVCHVQDWGNDVHHLRYRKLFNVTWRDLTVLCRPCHSLIHIILEHRKIMGARGRRLGAWRNTLRSAKRIYKMGLKIGRESALIRGYRLFTVLESGRAPARKAVVAKSDRRLHRTTGSAAA